MALTEADLRAIENLISLKIQAEVPPLIREEIKALPSKEEFYNNMDQIMGELRAIREEMVMMSGRLSDHEDRITDLENLHPGGAHASA